VGRGTTVRIVLPVAGGDPAPAAAAPPAATPPPVRNLA